jgi:hypothetical protein
MGAIMKHGMAFVLLVVFGMAAGCRGNVETTEDSTKVEVEAPKVEIGDQPVDLDPRTDDDVDVDTPAPGDT